MSKHSLSPRYSAKACIETIAPWIGSDHGEFLCENIQWYGMIGIQQTDSTQQANDSWDDSTNDQPNLSQRHYILIRGFFSSYELDEAYPLSSKLPFKQVLLQLPRHRKH